MAGVATAAVLSASLQKTARPPGSNWCAEETPIEWSNWWHLEFQDSTTMVGDRKTAELEYSLRFGPLIVGMSAEDATRRADPGPQKRLNP